MEENEIRIQNNQKPIEFEPDNGRLNKGGPFKSKYIQVGGINGDIYGEPKL